MTALVCNQRPLIFRLNDNGQGPDLVRQVCLERGWMEFDDEVNEDYDWNIWWKTSRFRQSEYDQILPWQRLNHYPKTTMITRKDCLARNLKRMQGVYGLVVFNFSPVAYNLPNDYTRFVADCSKLKEGQTDKAQFWICKPADLSRGRGIFIFRDLIDLQYDCNVVVQKYITNPLLISGYKFDLRIYVLVTSFHPLVLYVYQEGLVRFSTEKFDLSALGNVFSHLTNTSINKHSPSYTTEKERVGPGCKWTLTQLRQYLHQVNVDDQPIWAKIKSLIILTLLIQVPQAPKVTNCYEMYGFDILIDDSLKPWLLEVNFSPALSSDCQTDIMVKKPLLHDLFEMLNMKESDAERGGENFKQRQIDRAYGLLPSSRGSMRRPPSSRLQMRPADKFPTINNNGTGSGNVSRENTSISNDQDGECENEMTVPVVMAGCGLPSVQHPESPVQVDVSKLDNSNTSSRCSVDVDQSKSKLSTQQNSVSKPPKYSEMTPRMSSTNNRGGKLQSKNSDTSSSMTSLKSSDSKASLKNNLDTIKESRVSNAIVLKGKTTGESVNKGNNSDDGAEKQPASEQRKRQPSRESRFVRRGMSSRMLMDKRSSSFVSNTSSSTDSESIVPSPPKLNKQMGRVQRTRTLRQPLGYPMATAQRRLPRRQLAVYNQQHHRNLDVSAISVHQINTSLQEKKGAAKLPAKQIGNFFCLYPFNEASRRACVPNLDVRGAIRETQLQLKKELNAIKGANQRKANKKVLINAKHHFQIAMEDSQQLWGPLRNNPTEED